jgi:hypothetical protein
MEALKGRTRHDVAGEGGLRHASVPRRECRPRWSSRFISVTASGRESRQSEPSKPRNVASSKYEALQRDSVAGALRVHGLEWTALDVKGRLDRGHRSHRAARSALCRASREASIALGCDEALGGGAAGAGRRAWMRQSLSGSGRTRGLTESEAAAFAAVQEPYGFVCRLALGTWL